MYKKQIKGKWKSVELQDVLLEVEPTMEWMGEGGSRIQIWEVNGLISSNYIK